MSENQLKQGHELMMKLIRERSIVKQDVYDKTVETLGLLKEVLHETVEQVKSDFADADGRVDFYYKDQGAFESEIKVAGDILGFYMHTNVFQFDRSHSIWKSSYLENDELNGYVGVINVYNFLADSFKYQRVHDRGYLIARLFVNRDGHFMVQGKRQMGYLFNDFINSKIDRDQMRLFVQSSIIYSIGFDLYAPPYQSVQEVSVGEIMAMSHNLKIATGKRLGFKFSNEDDLLD